MIYDKQAILIDLWNLYLVRNLCVGFCRWRKKVKNQWIIQRHDWILNYVPDKLTWRWLLSKLQASTRWWHVWNRTRECVMCIRHVYRVEGGFDVRVLVQRRGIGQVVNYWRLWINIFKKLWWFNFNNLDLLLEILTAYTICLFLE